MSVSFRRTSRSGSNGNGHGILPAPASIFAGSSRRECGVDLTVLGGFACPIPSPTGLAAVVLAELVRER
jgi:hypothetical protein